MENMTKQAVIIAGPTASGKSEVAHQLARRVNGTIINCDSVQIYAGIENISASPFADHEISPEIDGIPYRLFSIMDLNQQLDVARYLDLARREYDAARRAERTPIFVGGTGYYINALVNGISPMPDISAPSRAHARDIVARDINAAIQMLPTDFTARDPQRVARALEVFLETGIHLSEFQRAPRTGAIVPTPYRILITPPTDVLQERIAARIPQMLAGGAVAEAKKIIADKKNPGRAIGAMQLCEWIRGNITRAECIHEWIIKTRQYAKRQRTMFRTQYNPDTIIDHVTSDSDIDDIVSKL